MHPALTGGAQEACVSSAEAGENKDVFIARTNICIYPVLKRDELIPRCGCLFVFVLPARDVAFCPLEVRFQKANLLL